MSFRNLLGAALLIGALSISSLSARAGPQFAIARKYALQFDGYCALAASLGYKAPGDALTGRIVDGKLYLNHNAEAARLWAEAIPANIRKGEENWPRLNPL